MNDLDCGRPRPAPAGVAANPLDEPQVRERLARLEAEIAELAAGQAQCADQIKDLLAREARGEGPFAGQIHELKQRRMMLATEIQHRKARLNRLLLGG